MMLRVERGRGDVDREVPLSRTLLETLREYWRWMRPENYLFPGTVNNWRKDKPITPKVVWIAVGKQLGGLGSTSTSPRTLCVTASQPTYSKQGRIFAPSKCCSGIKISRARPSTCTSRKSICEPR